jgi:hypothetical protein
MATQISGRVMCGLRGLAGQRRKIGQMKEWTAKSKKSKKYKKQ